MEFDTNTSIELVQLRLKHCEDMEKAYSKDSKMVVAMNAILVGLLFFINRKICIIYLISAGVSIQVNIFLNMLDKKRDFGFQARKLKMLLDFKKCSIEHEKYNDAEGDLN